MNFCCRTLLGLASIHGGAAYICDTPVRFFARKEKILEEALYVVSTVVQIVLSVIQLAMLLRAILSWFPMEPNGFTEFLYGITEPFIYPFRALFNRLNWFQNLPIDVAFSAAYISLFLIGILLP